jgi:uncharacterized protein DUF6891
MVFGMLPADTVRDLREQARHNVRGGYEQLQAIVDALVELVEFDPETQDLVASNRSRAVAEVAAIVAEENSSYLAEAATWPPETDCDRITAVFADLERNGIAAGENVGYTQGDLGVEMSEIVAELAKAGHTMRGWVGFHSQDVESAVDGRGLHLGFAPVDGKNKGAWVELGTEIVEAFKRAGFQVTWNGKANQRPHVAVDWKRRRSPRA